NFRPQFSLGAGLTSVPDAPSGKSNLYPGNTMSSDDKAAITRLEVDINDSLTAYGAVGYHVAQSAQNFPRATITSVQGATSVTNGYYDQRVTSTSADVGLRTRLNTGGIKHTLILGANMLDQQLDSYYPAQTPAVVSNLYNPAPLATITANRAGVSPTTQTRLTSVAITDTLSFADDRLRLIAGLRRQQVYTHGLAASPTSTNKTGISPVLGVVVKPVENLSLYASYTAALTAGTIVTAPNANAGQAFPPSRSKQYETGAKIDWGRITTTAAVFQIEQKNNSTEIVNGLQYATQNGRSRMRGLELSAYGELQRGLRFNASGTFFDTKLAHTAGGLTDGKEAGAVPKHNFNLGLDWDTPWVTGLALNTRVAHTGATWYDQNNRLRVPGWTRADIGARYITRTAGQAVTYRANIENLFDKNYWVMQNGYVGTASGRTFVLSAQVDF
ncbi:TonB-dependent siderophore receptor, partial [Herbaspirillum sp. YR522]|uniref:TonB-dependent receptor n=1 Tax=Herbaspirillum sp. YR522 TaxID=1144342 RepID=UPI00026FBC69